MVETFQLSNKALFSQAELRHIIITLGFWWFEELCITGNLPVWGLIEWQGANVGPCETPGRPDTQPGAAHLHHEYRGSETEREGACLISPSSSAGEKLAENLRQFATVWMGLVIPDCKLRDGLIGWAPAWPPACHYHKPSHPGSREIQKPRQNRESTAGLVNIYCLHFTT